MDGNILKYFAFIKTVECGSFTKAAQVLNYSQSGISRMIGDLEKEWKITLLERSRGGLCLTSDGLRVLPLARTLCADYEKLQSQVSDLNGLRSGMIRIGTFSSVATHWLPNIIRQFQKNYPNIDYELLLGDYAEIEEWIDEGRVDCGFLKSPVGVSLATVPLERDDFLAVLPEGHPLAAMDPVPLSSMCTESFLLLEKEGNGEVINIFRRCGLEPKVRFTTWDDYAIMSMVEGGMGISILPGLILKRHPYRIVTRNLGVPAYRDIVFAMKNRKTAPLSVKRFIDYLGCRQETQFQHK